MGTDSKGLPQGNGSTQMPTLMKLRPLFLAMLPSPTWSWILGHFMGSETCGDPPGQSRMCLYCNCYWPNLTKTNQSYVTVGKSRFSVRLGGSGADEYGKDCSYKHQHGCVWEVES